MNAIETINGEKYVHIGTLQHVLRGFIDECEENVNESTNSREIDILIAAAMTGASLHDSLGNAIIDNEFSTITEGIF